MIGAIKPAPFKPQKPIVVSWNTWKKGMNTLLRETEIDKQEMVTSTNLMLTGMGIPTKRWGSQLYFTASDMAKSHNVYRGVSISGLEFGSAFPGTLNQDFFTSAQNTYNYFGVTKKFSTVRLPFMWERIQPTLNGPLNATYKSYIDGEIAKAAAAGMRVILDMHNFGRRNIVSTGGFTSNFTSGTDAMWQGGTIAGGVLSVNPFARAYGGSVSNTGPYIVTADIGVTSDGAQPWNATWLEVMRQDDNNKYFVALSVTGGVLQLFKVVGGVQTPLGSYTTSFSFGTGYTLVVDIGQTTPGTISVSLNGTVRITASTDTALTTGNIALFGNGTTGTIDNVTLNIRGDTTTGIAGSGYFRIGDSQIPVSAFANVWQQIAAAYTGNSNVLGYDLMNEPHDMPVPTTTGNYNTTATVTLMHQAAINAIRTIDTIHYIFAEFDAWAGAQSFVGQYGSNPTPFLTDTTNLLVYSFHYYFDNDHSGNYAQAFASSNNTAISGDVTPVMQWAQNNNLNLHCGEFGAPNQVAWQVCLTTFFALVNTYNVWTNHWAAGDQYTSITTLQPASGSGQPIGLLMGITGGSGGIADQLQMSIVGLPANLSTTYLNPTTPTLPVAARFVGAFKDDNDNSQVLAITDWGYLTKQNGASYTKISGFSWASGYNVEGTQLGQKVYLTSSNAPLARYDFTTLTGFATIAKPTSVTVTNVSAASGLTTWSWRVTAESAVGETLPSTAVSLASLPQNLQTQVRVQWSPVSAASGSLTGYNVYRGYPGSEIWVGGTGPQTTYFDDAGVFGGDPTRIAPLFDTTSGPSAKYIMRFQDRLVLAGIPGSPTKVLISGRYPYHERFDWFGGGGSLLVEPDSGEDITGIGIYYRTSTYEQTIIVTKEHSIWEVVLEVQSFGDYAVLVPSYRLLTASQGCTSHRSIVAVENDVMLLNHRGIFIVRYEPNLYNIINANEISAKIRPFFQGLSNYDIQNATAIYNSDKKYVVAFPGSKQAICFDRERLCFTGPWTLPFNITKWANYQEQATGIEHWLAATDNQGQIQDFGLNYTTDSSIAIGTNFKSRKEDFSDWTLFKTLQEVYWNFADVTGNVQINVYIETRQGAVIAAKSVTISGPISQGISGIGVDEIGLVELGLTSGTSQNVVGELQKKSYLYKTARTAQIEIITTGVNASYKLLDITMTAIPQARGNNPTSWVI